MATPNPILVTFRAALDEMYGARLERVVLFGSRARGDARPDSDYVRKANKREVKRYEKATEPEENRR